MSPEQFCAWLRVINNVIPDSLQEFYSSLERLRAVRALPAASPEAIALSQIEKAKYTPPERKLLPLESFISRGRMYYNNLPLNRRLFFEHIIDEYYLSEIKTTPIINALSDDYHGLVNCIKTHYPYGKLTKPMTRLLGYILTEKIKEK